jgi:hypothetical protein
MDSLGKPCQQTLDGVLPPISTGGTPATIRARCRDESQAQYGEPAFTVGVTHVLMAAGPQGGEHIWFTICVQVPVYAWALLDLHVHTKSCRCRGAAMTCVWANAARSQHHTM